MLSYINEVLTSRNKMMEKNNYKGLADYAENNGTSTVLGKIILCVHDS